MRKNIVWKTVKIVMAVFMLFGGIQHFTNTLFYAPFVPDFLEFKTTIIYGSGLIEIIIGLLLITKKYEAIGTLALLTLMFVFLPIHIWDVFSEQPAIGSHQAALIRLPVQFLFIAISWKLKNTFYKQN